jgi:hypothetical protein
LIDLPRNPDGKLTDPGVLTHFAVELIHFLTAMGISQGVIDSMRKFDFSRTANLAFIHSMYVITIPGEPGKSSLTFDSAEDRILDQT